MFGTLASTFLALFLVAVAAAHVNKDVAIFWDPVGISLVLGGTFMVAIITFGPRQVWTLAKTSLLVMRQNNNDAPELAREIISLVRDTRCEVNALQTALPQIVNPFLRDGIALVVERIEAHKIETILRDRIRVKQESDKSTANMLKTLAKYPPSFGIIGTVLGLIALMMQLGQDGGAGRMGPAMAVGLVATFYGLVLTNFVLQPLSENLALKSYQDIRKRQMAMIGILLIKDKEDTVVAQESVNSLLPVSARVDVLGLGTEIEQGDAAMRTAKEELINIYGGAGTKRKDIDRTSPKVVRGIKLDNNEFDEHEEGEGHGDGTWIFSFADLIMNLLMFFVMMFAISSIDKNKVLQIQQAFSSLHKPDAKDAKGVGGTGESPTYATNIGIQSSASNASLSSTELLSRIQGLMKQLDEKTSAKDDKEILKIKPQIEKFAALIEAKWKLDPQAQAFEIAIAAPNLFTKDLQLSKSGKDIVDRLGTELALYRKNLDVHVRAFVSRESGISETQALRLSSEWAGVVATELQKTKLSNFMPNLALAGFGFLPLSSGVSNLVHGSCVIVRVAIPPLLAENSNNKGGGK